MITPRDVTVVVQGPYHPDLTPQCLASVARILPGAEVILSLSGRGAGLPARLAADVVLENDDPGAVDLRGVLSPVVEHRTNITSSNLNRQLVSTRNGLRRAGRPYALKLRTDMTLEHAGFLDFADRFRGIPGPLKFLEERVVTTNARSPHRSFCFFVQDFCFFGRTADLLQLWDIPLFPSREELLALPQEERDARVLVPEQHILLSFLRRHMDIPLRNALDTSLELRELSEKAIASNFVCLDVRRFGAHTLKPSLAWVNEPGEIRYTWLWILKASFAEFVSWCVRHCGHDVSALIDGFRAEYEAEVADLPLKNALIQEGGHLNAEALLWLGERAHREGKLAPALNAYVTLTRAGYDHHRLNYGLGVLQVQTGNPQAGVANIETALKKAPDFLPGYESLANYHRQAGDPEAAACWQRELEQRRQQA